MIINNTEKLKKDFESLRDNFSNKTNLKIEFLELPINSRDRASCLYGANNSFKIYLRLPLTQSDYILVIHELFHGILLAIEGFSDLFFNNKYKNTNIEETCNIISSYIDDMVVHRRIFELGYNFLDKNYYYDIKNNLNLILKGKSHLALNIHGTGMIGNLFKALYCIQAKDCKKNYKNCFKKNDFHNLDKFIQIFPNKFKASLDYVSEIEKLLKNHNVHTAIENDLIKKGIVKTIGLDDKIQVKKH